MISTLLKLRKKSAVLCASMFLSVSAFSQLGLNWSEMGPNNAGGRCRSIIIDRLDASANTLYAAGVSGGLFKSVNGANSWSSVDDQSPSLIVSCMAQAKNGTIFLGTGETFGGTASGDGSTGFVGTGLYKLNAGSSSVVLVSDSSFFGNINEIACDNNDANRVYVASQKGLMLTTDGGANWTAISTSPAMDVKVDADNGVYYSEGTNTGSTSNVFYSSSGNVGTFNDITPSITNRGRIEIATSPSNSNYVYVSIAANSAISLRAVYISNNKGTNWSLISLGTAQFDPLSGSGQYVHTLLVDPSNPESVYLGGVYLYKWAQTPSASLGQGSWTNLNFSSSQFFFGFMVHDIKINPFDKKTVYYATDAGVYKTVSTSNPNNYPLQAIQMNKGFNITQFYSVSPMTFPHNGSGSSTGSVSPVGGVVGSAHGVGLAYLPGSYLDPQTSLKYREGDNLYQTEASKVVPGLVFATGRNGLLYRTGNVNSSNLATFTDKASYEHPSYGAPGSSGFGVLRTPMALWENYGHRPATDSAIFYNDTNRIDLFVKLPSQEAFAVTNKREQRYAKFQSVTIRATSVKKSGLPKTANYSFNNNNVSASTFTIPNMRTQSFSKYDSIIVKATSTKKMYAYTTFTNDNVAQTTFTVSSTRPQNYAKYDSIIIISTSSKSLTPPPSQTITIRPFYTGTTITSYSISGASTSSPTNNLIFLDGSGTDSIRFTFNNAPNDSSDIWVKFKYRYAQDFTIVPVYSGTAIASYNISGEASVSSATNNVVFPNSNLNDSIRFTFASPPNDSSVISVRFRNGYYRYINIYPTHTGTAIASYTIEGEANTSSANNNIIKLNNSSYIDSVKFRFSAPIDSMDVKVGICYIYNAGDYIIFNNTDVPGIPIFDSVQLSAPLTASISPVKLIKYPLRVSARLAIGTSKGIFVQKRPLDLNSPVSIVRIAGNFSRADSANTMVPKKSPVKGSVTNIVWSNDGRNLYFSTKHTDTSYYVYRVSNIDFIGDYTSKDYSGRFANEIDTIVITSTGTQAQTTARNERKVTSIRTAPLGRFKYPVTSISIIKEDTAIVVTTGSYNNKTATVYYSTGNIKKALVDSSYASVNFSAKNGAGGTALPFIPAYSSLSEMNNGKRVLVGTETGIYSTSDITQANPVWVKENNGQLPNVPVFQIKQQTMPSYVSFNSGVIYAATHGRGIWSSANYLAPYSIGIEEEAVAYNVENSLIKLYPNPGSNYVNVSFQSASEANFKVKVMDLSGRVIIENSLGKLQQGNQVIEVNTQVLSNGVYFVNVSGSNGFNSVSKLIIAK